MYFLMITIKKSQDDLTNASAKTKYPIKYPLTYHVSPSASYRTTAKYSNTRTCQNVLKMFNIQLIWYCFVICLTRNIDINNIICRE